jgi:DNA-binding GntR family transcriptional regulator
MAEDSSVITTGFDDETIRIGGQRNKIGDPTGKAGQIVTIMEQRLMLGYYSPGQMLSFNMLADEFKVSRQPVGAAIAHLRTIGYVEVIPHTGCQVVHPSFSEIKDFFLLLGKIESSIAALAATRYEGGEDRVLLSIKPPKELVKLMRMHEQRKVYIQYVDRYHDQIWKMARTPLLEGKIVGLRRLAHFYLWQGIPTLTSAAAKKMSAERDAIAKALIERDGETVAKLMEEHISRKPELAGINLAI